MARYRNGLPQLSDVPFLTDGGLETTLIFDDGFELPEFASFILLDDEKGVEAMRNYYRKYADIAADMGTGFVLETPTWRANPKWAGKLGYDRAKLEELNRRSVDFISGLRTEYDDRIKNIVLSGNIGPHDDGYSPTEILSADEAERYHSEQIRVFADTEADLVTALTMTYSNEAIGIVRSAKTHRIPSVVSFTVETDGQLPSGQPLGDAIREVDLESGGPEYYMVNCAHPSHFDFALESGSDWSSRIYGTRVNASKMSHEELDNAEELDEGNPEELAADHAAIFSSLSHLNIIGGCCGTNENHVAEAAKVLVNRNALSADS